MSTPIENRYWNSNGEAQNLYDEMQNAGWVYTKASESAFHAYYRSYNYYIIHVIFSYQFPYIV